MTSGITYIHVQPNTDLSDVLDAAESAPVRLEKGSVIYRLVRENSSAIAEYDPEKVREAVRATAGSWGDLDTDAIIEALYRAREEGSRPADRP